MSMARAGSAPTAWHRLRKGFCDGSVVESGSGVFVKALLSSRTGGRQQPLVRRSCDLGRASQMDGTPDGTDAPVPGPRSLLPRPSVLAVQLRTPVRLLMMTVVLALSVAQTDAQGQMDPAPAQHLHAKGRERNPCWHNCYAAPRRATP